MKKIIKILPIILFIVLFLAIAPSYTVNAEEPPVTFQSGRDSSYIGDAETVTVTGITSLGKNESSYLYCADKWHGAVYADGIWTGTRQILRGTADSFILANVDDTTLGEEGTKYDGQEAWWQMRGAGVPEYENSLYMGANDYESWVNGSHNISVDKSNAKLSLTDRYGIVRYGPINISCSDYAVINGETLGGFTWDASPAGAVSLVGASGSGGTGYLEIDITKLNGSKKITFSVYSNVKIYVAVVYNLTGTYPRTCTTNKYRRTRILRSKCSIMWTRWTTRLCKCAFSK